MGGESAVSGLLFMKIWTSAMFIYPKVRLRLTNDTYISLEVGFLVGMLVEGTVGRLVGETEGYL